MSTYIRELGDFRITLVLRGDWSGVATIILDEIDTVPPGRHVVTSILAKDLVDGRIPDPLPPMDAYNMRACEWGWAVSLAAEHYYSFPVGVHR